MRGAPCGTALHARGVPAARNSGIAFEVARRTTPAVVADVCAVSAVVLVGAALGSTVLGAADRT